MPTPHIHLHGMEVLKIVAILIVINFLAQPLVAHHRDNSAIQGLGWDLGYH